MARANRRRLFRLPRRADQQPGAERVSIPRPRSLASAAMPAQPKSKNAMDTHDETGRRVPPPAASPASLAECALRRQTPEVGAECPNWARSELSGGRSETSVPTGNFDGMEHYYAIFQMAGQSTVVQNDHTVELAVGDVALVDAARPVTYVSEKRNGQWLSLQL